METFTQLTTENLHRSRNFEVISDRGRNRFCEGEKTQGESGGACKRESKGWMRK